MLIWQIEGGRCPGVQSLLFACPSGGWPPATLSPSQPCLAEVCRCEVRGVHEQRTGHCHIVWPPLWFREAQARRGTRGWTAAERWTGGSQVSCLRDSGSGLTSSLRVISLLVCVLRKACLQLRGGVRTHSSPLGPTSARCPPSPSLRIHRLKQSRPSSSGRHALTRVGWLWSPLHPTLAPSTSPPLSPWGE